MTHNHANLLNAAADSIERNVRCQTHTEANGKTNAVDHLRHLAAEAQPNTSNPNVITDRVLSQVLAERIAQDTKWGEQNHNDGTGNKSQQDRAEFARRWCKSAFESGYGTWADVLTEEVAEAEAERDPATLRAELLQVAAVAVAWIEAIDRRTA